MRALTDGSFRRAIMTIFKQTEACSRRATHATEQCVLAEHCATVPRVNSNTAHGFDQIQSGYQARSGILSPTGGMDFPAAAG